MWTHRALWSEEVWKAYGEFMYNAFAEYAPRKAGKPASIRVDREKLKSGGGDDPVSALEKPCEDYADTDYSRCTEEAINLAGKDLVSGCHKPINRETLTASYMAWMEEMKQDFSGIRN